MADEVQSGRLADSMEQAAAMLALPIQILKLAKKQGCPAFRAGARVNLDELREWLDENPTNPNDLPDKEQVQILLGLERLEEQRIINAKLRDELMPIKDVCDRLRAIQEELKNTLKLRLIDQLPALNAGLDAPKQRENNRAMFIEICERLQAWAREYDEKLKKNEEREERKRENPPSLNLLTLTQPAQ